MRIIVDTKNNIDKMVSDEISALVAEKPTANLSFAGGETTKGIYKALSNSGVDFKSVKVFNICEYLGPEDSDERLLKNVLSNELYAPLGIENIHNPNGESEEEALKFDDEIDEHGGIDLILLGIGLNGHIGFNEPATLYDTKTHIARITDSTKRMKASVFGGEGNVPDFGVTMGLKTICSAKNVLLVAYGEEKAEIIHKLVYGKTQTYVPAAMLQMHMNFTLYLDEAAASKLN